MVDEQVELRGRIRVERREGEQGQEGEPRDADGPERDGLAAARAGEPGSGQARDLGAERQGAQEADHRGARPEVERPADDHGPAGAGGEDLGGGSLGDGGVERAAQRPGRCRRVGCRPIRSRGTREGRAGARKRFAGLGDRRRPRQCARATRERWRPGAFSRLESANARPGPGTSRRISLRTLSLASLWESWRDDRCQRVDVVGRGRLRAPVRNGEASTFCSDERPSSRSPGRSPDPPVAPARSVGGRGGSTATGRSGLVARDPTHRQEVMYANADGPVDRSPLALAVHRPTPRIAAALEAAVKALGAHRPQVDRDPGRRASSSGPGRARRRARPGRSSTCGASRVS